MVDTGIFATTAEIGYKAGANCSATSKAEAYTNSYVSQAESYINVATGYNWSDAYGTLNQDKKCLLKQVASDIAAMYVINYDMGGFNKIEEAQTMLDFLRDRVAAGIELLKLSASRDFIIKT